MIPVIIALVVLSGLAVVMVLFFLMAKKVGVMVERKRLGKLAYDNPVEFERWKCGMLYLHLCRHLQQVTEEGGRL